MLLPGSATNNRGCHRDGVCACAALDIVGAGLLRPLADEAAFLARIVYIFAMRNGDSRSTRLKWNKRY